MLTDNHNRVVDYLRLSVTDKCNLRCRYCMPAEGVPFGRREEILSWEEMIELCRIVVDMGVRRIRITGGEPFVRKNLLFLLDEISQLPGLDDISITTNATLIDRCIPELQRMNISNINVSLDTLHAGRFFAITRRDMFNRVMENLGLLLDNGFRVKINCVVLKDRNIEDIVPFIEFANANNINVRFLEEMPFNGNGKDFTHLEWDHIRILEYIRKRYPLVWKLPSPPNSTSVNYGVEGYEGSFGIIPAFSRTFCGTCNRLRISAKGELRTCLYSSEKVKLKPLLAGNRPEEVRNEIRRAIGSRFRDGFEAEKQAREKESMTLIGG